MESQPEPITADITPKEAVLSWSSLQLTYNGQAQGPSVTIENIVEGDAYFITLAGTGKDIGDYTATVTDLQNNNYKIPADASMSFRIVPLAAIIGWGPDTFHCDGKPHVRSAHVENIMQSDTVELTISGEATEPGTYTASVTGTSNPNYVLVASETAQFTIEKKPVIAIVVSPEGFGSVSMSSHETYYGTTISVSGNVIKFQDG